MTDDAELLNQFVERGSEDAFSELVRRHLPMVYSTALRQLGNDTELAQDVSQTVFIDLARKARSLLGHKLLAGWLHASTRFAAATARRSRQRRQNRERLAASLQEVGPPCEPDRFTAEIAPVIDDAIAKLDAVERDAVLLRFFQGKDHKAVGLALGISDDAARMRVARALDRLRSLLSRRGVTLSAAALGVMLSAQAVAVVPAGLPAVVTAGAIASAASHVGAFTMLKLAASMTKLKVSAIAALAVAGAVTPLVWIQQTQLSGLREENLSLRQELNQAAENQRIAREMSLPPVNVAGSEPAISSAELQRLREQSHELLRARNELHQLRDQLAQAGRAPRPASGVEPPARATVASSAMDITNYPLALQGLLATNYTRALTNLAAAKTQQLRYLALPAAAKLSFVFGDTNAALAYATEALALDGQYLKEPWRQGEGQAVHDANETLGRLALLQGDADQARQFLLAAGQTPGSPTLNTFGPNMNLAKDLLKAGDTDTVLQYFNLCSRFWGETNKLAEWTALVRGGIVPDFGGNLLY